MEKSRIPVRARKDDKRTGERQEPGSSSTALPGPSTAEQSVGKRLLPSSSSISLPEASSAEHTTDKRLSPDSSSIALPGNASSGSAEQHTDNRLLAEQTHLAHKNGRQIGHYFANGVAKDNSRVHYGDNYNATHHHNYQGPDANNTIPRNLEEAIARDKVKPYLDHVMELLSFERMGLRKGTVVPALVNTCQWLLDSPEYISWRNPDQIREHHGFMWIKSKAGAGKSTTMKFLLESTRSQDSGEKVISFFFNARGVELEKTLNGLYRHLLHQLLWSVSRLQYSMVDDINEIASQGWQLQPLKDLLRRAVLDLRSEPFTCFIDALDESSEDEIRELIEFFEELGSVVVAKHIGFRVCFSSRHYPNVELEKCRYLNLDEKAGHEDDIALYIRSKLRPRRSGVYDDLPDLVQKKAQGVFLWVVLVTQILKKDYDRGDVHKAHSRLKIVPPGLHNLFHEMIHRNAEDPDDNRYLLSVLQWIAFARLPLTPHELYFAVRSENSDFDIPQLWDPNGVSFETMKLFILNCSKGLAELTTYYPEPYVLRRAALTESHGYPTFQFIHESVRDYLQETGFEALKPGRGKSLFGAAHDDLKHCCLRWITSNARVERLYHFVPFLTYAVSNLIYHAEMACEGGVSQDDFVESFPLEIYNVVARSFSEMSANSLEEILRYQGAYALRAAAKLQRAAKLPSISSI